MVASLAPIATTNNKIKMVTVLDTVTINTDLNNRKFWQGNDFRQWSLEVPSDSAPLSDTNVVFECLWVINCILCSDVIFYLHCEVFSIKLQN
ncbi:hypothetical protein NPIL_204371 [Nephila pilipes]|uniref:Uncharacterized protein n=1 Tax=Nephila pilipes TaxID=299642 RepID=A0A8X6TXL1_NEPPI|nr:hypothetical protein NPIL_204371 [Nephila pilipes]